ncbi:MAG: molybdopterin converting factor subunit 1 [Gammaproteobacteria bacterium]
MSVKVRFFASLRERLGRTEEVVAFESGDTAGTIWARVTGEAALPSHILVAVNQRYAREDAAVADGDEVAFLPPVTGGLT